MRVRRHSGTVAGRLPGRDAVAVLLGLVRFTRHSTMRCYAHEYSSFHSASSIAFYPLREAIEGIWHEAASRAHHEVHHPAASTWEMVPLADTTIYDMEQRGISQRFYLTSRCVVWDLAEVEAWLEERRVERHAPRR